MKGLEYMRSNLLYKITCIKKGANNYTGEKEVRFWTESTTGLYYIPNTLEKWCYWERYYA